MSNQIVIAQKDGITRKFTRRSWDLLKNKNGWVEVNSITAQKMERPPMGEMTAGRVQPSTKEVAVPRKMVVLIDLDNAMKLLAKEANAENNARCRQLIEAVVAEDPESELAAAALERINVLIGNQQSTSIQPESEPKNETPDQPDGVSDEKKAKFVELLKDFNKGSIKDYFDAVGVKYDAAAKIDALKTQLAEHFGYDEEKFKAALD